MGQNISLIAETALEHHWPREFIVWAMTCVKNKQTYKTQKGAIHKVLILL